MSVRKRFNPDKLLIIKRLSGKGWVFPDKTEVYVAQGLLLVSVLVSLWVSFWVSVLVRVHVSPCKSLLLPVQFSLLKSGSGLGKRHLPTLWQQSLSLLKSGAGLIP